MKNILYYIFGLFIISSCSPNQDENGDFLRGIEYDTQIGGGSTTSKQLKKMETHLEDITTGTIENHSYTYTYTGAKLVSYKDEQGITTRLDYNTNNKISKVSNVGQTSLFEYSGSNVSKVVTTITDLGKITSTYSFTSGKLSKTISIQEYSVPFPLKMYIETTYQYQGENVVKSLIKSGIYDPVTGDLEMSPEDQTISFTYDAKKSPYKLLPTEYILLLAGIGPQGAAYLSANNFEKVTIAVVGNPTETMTFKHDYNSENYPTKSTADKEYIQYTY